MAAQLEKDERDARSAGASAIIRADGVTAAERLLKRLCDHSFLSMWSYSGIYRDQGRNKDIGDGKEVCDLIVVFENHIIIFSDKDCDFPDTGNPDLDWSRWYKRAVRKSAEQIWGAERWLLLTQNDCFWIANVQFHFQLIFLIPRSPKSIVLSSLTQSPTDASRSLVVPEV